MTAVDSPHGGPPRLVHPRSNETFVLLRAEEYERLKEYEYDDSSWTRSELEMLAWQTADQFKSSGELS